MVTNSEILEEFNRLVKYIQIEIDADPKNKMKNYYRLRHIKDAIKIIENYPKQIKSGDQLKDIKGIGQGIISRIDEIIKTGFLSEIKINTEDEEYMKEIKELEQIYGIGRTKAYDLIKNHNIKSIKDLRDAHKRGEITDSHIILGLKYHNIYKQNIPRSEIMKVDKYLEKVTAKIDPDLCHVICGSYRRKKKTSNDIDVLLVHKKIKTRKQQISEENYLRKFVGELKKDKFILDDLDENYEVKYMGFSKYENNPVRRIDIMYVPYESYYTALFHFTGSGEFNRRIRDVAKSMGYKLSQLGLFDKEDNEKRIKIGSEKAIFKKLNLEYVKPEDRS